MGGWFSAFFWEEEVKEKKIVMVGLDNAGKSTILYKLVEEDKKRHGTTKSENEDDEQQRSSLLSRFFTTDYGSSSSSADSFTSSNFAQTSPKSSSKSPIVNLAPTIGFQVEAVRCGDGGPILAVWDVGGQTRLRQMWPICYSGAAAAVFVVDAADLTEPQRLSDARAALGSLLSAPELKGSPLLLLANKSDDPRAMTPRQVLESLQLLSSSAPASSAPSQPEPVSYSASLAGYATIPSGSASSSVETAVSTSFSPLLKGRRWWVQATCGLTGEGLEEGFKWLADTLTFLDEQREAAEDNTRWN